VREAAGKSVAGRWSRFAAPEERTTSTVAKILFLNIPASGHVNPTLAVARELIGRGDRVCYALPESWRETIENAGAEFAPLAETLRSARSGHGQNLSHDARIALMPYAMAREAPRIAPELERLVQAEKPDCIVFNELDLPAKLAVRLTGVPAAAFRTFHGRVARARDAGWATGPVANYMTAADQTFASFLARADWLRRRWPNFVLKSTIRRSSSSPRRFKSIALRSISDSSLSVLRWRRRPRCRQTFRSGRRRVES